MYAIKSTDGTRIARLVLSDLPAGETYESLNAWEIVPDPLPEFDVTTQRVVPLGYRIVSGHVRQLWKVESLPDGEIYATKLQEGYVDGVTGIKLKTTEHAQSRFTSQVTLLKLAIDLGAANAATPQTFFDYHDTEQTLPASDLIGLMLRYGSHCQSLFINFAP